MAWHNWSEFLIFFFKTERGQKQEEGEGRREEEEGRREMLDLKEEGTRRKRRKSGAGLAMDLAWGSLGHSLRHGLGLV